MSGVVSAGFSTTVLPHASAGAIFHAAMSSGKFHGMICPATPSGPARCAREGVVELVGPTGVVEEVRRGERDVDVARLLDRLAAVHRLDDGELAGLLLQQRARCGRCTSRVRRRASSTSTCRRPRARLSRRRRRPAAFASATSASICSVLGLIVSKYLPLRGVTQLPPMKRPYFGSILTWSGVSGAGA